MYPNSSRYSKSNVYQQDCAIEHDAKFPGERTSEETVVDEEEGVNGNNLHNYPNETIYVNVIPKHNNAIREKYQRFKDRSEFNMPDAVIAMQKLQKLKELQTKRDLSERYYSQEIKRLIDEYYLGVKTPISALRPIGKLQSTSFQPFSENRYKNLSKMSREKNLEPCGTMTTITRLDCGCVQETTRPIFTTPKGRIHRRNCNQSQNEMFLKLTSSNPQEHLTSSLEESRKERYRAKSKKRMHLDPRIYARIPPAGDQEYEMEHENRHEQQEPETIDRIPRAASPRRKFSDTSATSV